MSLTRQKCDTFDFKICILDLLQFIVYSKQCGLLQPAIANLPGEKVELPLKTEVGRPPWPAGL